MKTLPLITRISLIFIILVSVGCRSMQTPRMHSYLDQSKATDANACLAISKNHLTKVFTDKMDKLNNLETAIDAAQKAMALQPDLLDAKYLLGYGYGLKGIVLRDEAKVSQGIAFYKNAITQKPALAGPGGYLPPLHYMIAVIRLNGKDFRFTDDHAIKLIEEAIRIYPEFAPSHYELAKIYRKQNKIELAIQQIKIAADFAPDNGPIQKELGLLYARYLEDKNELVFESAANKGIEALKNAVKLIPKDPEIHEALGKYYGVLGMFELKAFEMDTAIGLKPKGSYYLELGNAYLSMGNTDKAQNAYLEAVKIDPSLTKANGLSGYCDYLKNRFDTACGQFDQYTEDQSLKELYRKLWHYYALWGGGKKSKGDELLEGFSGTFNGNDWERTLLDFHLNRINEAELVAKAKTRFDQCEAFYYIGSRHWHDGDKTGAEDFYRKAMDTKIYDQFEYAGARIRIGQLSSLSAKKTK
jgi:tetratricopeptide (TPR) repeat protein